MSSKNRISYLDSLRGLAAVSVVFSHFTLMYGLPANIAWISRTPLHILWDGALAVSLFFILSGFVLSLSYIDDAQKRKNFRFLSYACVRIFRIVPLALIAVGCSIILQRTLFNPISTIPSFEEWPKLFWIHPFSFSTISEYMPQIWSLFVELPASVFVPLIAIALTKKVNPRAIFLGAYILILFLGLNKFVFDFILGILIANGRRDIHRIWKQTTSYKKAVFFIAGAIIYTSQYFLPVSFIHYLNIFAIDMLGYGAAVLLIITLESAFIQKILNIKFFVFLGEISYGIYLFHFALLMTFCPLLLQLLNRNGIYDEFFTRYFVLFFVLTGTICVSWLGKKFIEDPCIAFGKRLKEKIDTVTSL